MYLSAFPVAARELLQSSLPLKPRRLNAAPDHWNAEAVELLAGVAARTRCA